jgi:hypothetical protein
MVFIALGKNVLRALGLKGSVASRKKVESNDDSLAAVNSVSGGET